MSPRDIDAPAQGGRDESLDSYGAFGALPAVIAFWFLVATAGALGWAIYDALLVGAL